MPHPLKPYKTIAEQIDLLRSRKMIIDDQSLAEQWLQTVGYYRLSGYWYTRRIKNPPGSPTYRGDDFMPDTKFSDIAQLYEFDRKLRTQVHDGIERVEIALRTALAETLGGIDRLAFYNRDNFRIRKYNEYAHYELISTVSSRVNRALKAKDSFHIRHNVEKYGTQLAPWVLMDVFDFSDLSKLFRLLNADEQSEVAALVGIDTRSLTLSPTEAKDLRKDHPLSAALRQLSILRNKSAHHARIWNCTLVPIGTRFLVKLDGLATLPTTAQNQSTQQFQSERLYGALLLIAQILQTVSPGSSWAGKTAELVATALQDIPFLTEDELGFPPNWRSESVWQ